MNSIGQLIRLTTFGESHGPAMGGILDGMPPLVHIDLAEIQRQLQRRAPGRQPLTSQRREPDKVEILSGINADGFTLGTPIGFIIRNRDQRPSDYSEAEQAYRPCHADYTYQHKYGIRDPRGGGRQSARETVNWTVAGAICCQWLDTRGISIEALFKETCSVKDAAAAGDSCGGIVECLIKGVPVGLGEPVFDKLHSRLAAAMMGINAAKAFEYGDGFAAASMLGSESLDTFLTLQHRDPEGHPCSANHSGGIQGGISNGMDINFRVYFKPTPTLMQEVETIDISEREQVTLPVKGRHDPCVAIRAVPVVEAMAALTIADFLRIAGI